MFPYAYALHVRPCLLCSYGVYEAKKPLRIDMPTEFVDSVDDNHPQVDLKIRNFMRE